MTSAQTDNTFDWTLPWGKVPASVVDQSSLNSPIEDKDRISVRDGHFFNQAGQRVRFVGMNIVAGDCFPKKEKAEEIALRLRRFGVNFVRLHQMDAPWAEPNLFFTQGATNKRPTQEISNGSMDRLDYFIYHLSRNGIYVDINFHTFRGFKGDAIPSADQVDDSGKPLNYFNERMIELQCRLIDQILKRENRYTKHTYATDPAIATVELTNENSLFDKADELGNLPEAYRDQLTGKWNAFLNARYGGNAGLLDAWSKSLAPAGAEMLRNGRFEQNVSNWSVNGQNGARGHLEHNESRDDDDSPPGDVLAVRQDRRGNEEWNLQLIQSQLSLEPGKVYTLTYYAKSTKDRTVQVSTQLQQEPWSQLGLNTSIDVKTSWRKFSHTFVANHFAVAQKGGILFSLGKNEGDLILADVSLKPGGGDVKLPRDQSVERGNVALQKLGPTRAGRDLAEFLMQIERDYAARLRQQIRNTGAQMPIICSQASYGVGAGVLRELDSDYIDMHGYWQHPSWPGEAWDANNYRVQNTSMVRSAKGGELANLASYRVAGKPFVVSEYDHPAPAESASEMIPMIFAVAATQDWDGVVLFNYNHGYSAPNEPADWKSHVDHWFDQGTHGGKLSFLPTAARAFRLGQLPPAEVKATLEIGKDQLRELAGQSWIPLWEQAGTKMTTRFLTGYSAELRVVDGSGVRLQVPDNVSSNSALQWNVDDPNKAMFIAHGQLWKAVVGAVGGQRVELGDVVVTFGSTSRGFGVFSLGSLNDQPIAKSASMLLTLVDKVENRNAQWNRERTFAGNLTTTGQGGSMRAFGLSADVEIRIEQPLADVWALSPDGTRRQKIASTVTDNQLRFHVGPEHQTLWYEITTKPAPPPPPAPPAPLVPATKPATKPATAPSTQPASRPSTGPA